ncbi:MAG: hypothetical protein ACFHXK_02880 [bacterium]
MYLSGPHRVAGAGLVAAIALITIVAVLTVAITRSVALGAGSTALETLNQRAMLAAGNGAQLGLNRVFAPTGVGGCAGQTFDFSSLAGLPACQAEVSCSSETVRGRIYYTLNSVGSCSAGSQVAQREVLVQATP